MSLHDDIPPYRSQAERTRVKQTWALITLAVAQVVMNVLVALHLFNILH